MTEETTNRPKRCIEKDDKSGCRLIYCEDLTSKCERFFTGFEEINCVLNQKGNQCQLANCTEQPISNCGGFTPYTSSSKCTLNINGTQCEIQDKDCEELDPEECRAYHADENSNCVLDSSAKKCKKIHCEDLASSQCSTFRLYVPNKVCLPDGEKCKVKSCSEFSTKEECEAIKFTDEGYKCVFSDDNGCEFSQCYYDKTGGTPPTNCEEFIPINALYKCTKDKYGGVGCGIYQKECEELQQGQCDLFNTEDNLEDKGKCFEKNGYCVLDYSQNLDFSILFLFLLFFFL